MPPLFQDILFSGYDLKISSQRYSSEYSKFYKKLKKSEWLSEDEIFNYKNKKFLDIINFAYSTVPFYKKFYDDNGVKIDKISSLKDIHELPILTKDLVRKNNLKLISEKFKKQNLIKYVTSGTSGKPLEIYRTKRANSFQFAIAWRHKARFGITRKDSRLTFGGRIAKGYEPNSKVIANSFLTNRSYINGCDINPINVEDIVNFINSTIFGFYEGYPSAIDTFSKLIIEKDLTIINRPKIIFAGSEYTTQSQRDRWLKTFGAQSTEHYANAEFAGCLSKCEYGNFHEDFECGHVEALSTEDTETKRMILSGWGNPAMPFIRYEVGDTIQPLKIKCLCGRKSVCFEELSGRQEDYIFTPDRKKIMGISHVFKKAKNVIEMQVEQNSIDSINLKVVPDENFTEGDLDLVLSEFSRRSGDTLSVKIIITKEIKTIKGKKFKRVISNIPNKDKYN